MLISGRVPYVVGMAIAELFGPEFSARRQMQEIDVDKDVFLQPQAGGKKHDHIALVSAKVEGRAYDVSIIWYALVCLCKTDVAGQYEGFFLIPHVSQFLTSASQPMSANREFAVIPQLFSAGRDFVDLIPVYEEMGKKLVVMHNFENNLAHSPRFPES
jgi:hypothetical protein